MDVLPEEDILNIQLIQELRQQRDKLNRRLLDLGVYRGAPTQQQSPTIDQEMGEIGSQLKSLRLSKTEPTGATRAMPFLN
jgi:hypothetical protein